MENWIISGKRFDFEKKNPTFQKKAVQALIKKPEPEKIVPKRPSDARDAREVARKLIKSGAIQAIQKKPVDPTSFKRPKQQGKQQNLGDLILHSFLTEDQV